MRNPRRRSNMPGKDDRRNEALVTIATFPNTFEASLARGALEAAGIAALVRGEMLGAFARLQPGGVIAAAALQVFESDRDRAPVELRRMQIRIVDPRSD